MEQIKNTNVNVPLWSFLTLPSQWELLQQELQADQGQGILVATNEVVSLLQPTNVGGTSKKSKPSPIYIYI